MREPKKGPSFQGRMKKRGRGGGAALGQHDGTSRDEAQLAEGQAKAKGTGPEVEEFGVPAASRTESWLGSPFREKQVPMRHNALCCLTSPPDLLGGAAVWLCSRAWPWSSLCWILLLFFLAPALPCLFCPAAPRTTFPFRDSTRLDLHERPPALLSRQSKCLSQPAASRPPASPRESESVCVRCPHRGDGCCRAQSTSMADTIRRLIQRSHPTCIPISNLVCENLLPSRRLALSPSSSSQQRSQTLSPPPPPIRVLPPFSVRRWPRTPTRLASFDLHFAASTLACLPRVFGSPRQSVPAARPHIRLQVPPPFRPRPPARSRRSLVFNPNTTNPSPASTFLVCLCLDRPTVYRRDRPPSRIQPSLRRCAASLLSATHAASSLVSRLCPQQAAFSLLLPAWPTPLSRRTAFPLVLAI